MKLVRKKLLFVSCYFTILLLGCDFINTPIEKNDIYARCAKGDTISFELFKKAQRIEKTDKWFFVWLDLYEDGESQYAPHLLACDHRLVLKGATGIIPNISEAKGDTLFGFTSEEYVNNKAKSIKPYRDDSPKEIVLNLKKSKESTWNGYQRRAEAIVDSIQFFPDLFSVRMFTRIADSAFFPGRKQYFEDIEYSKAFSHTKIIELPISSLHFHRGRDYVYIIEANDVIYEIHALEDKVFEKLLFDIWQTIKP